MLHLQQPARQKLGDLEPRWPKPWAPERAQSARVARCRSGSNRMRRKSRPLPPSPSSLARLWSSVARRLTRRLARPRGVLAPVEADDGRFSFAHRRHADRPFPHAHQRAQGLLGVVGAQIDALVLVPEQELAAIFEVAVLHVDEGVTGVGQLKEQLVFDLFEFARHDLVTLVAIRPREAEEL